MDLLSPIAWIFAVLYALAMAALLMYGLNLLWLAVQYARGRRTRPRLSPDAPAPDDTWPDVTVQLPLYNEPYVTARLIDACARLTYPRGKLEIQVLDDSTDETGRIAAERVVYWHTRGIDIAHIRRNGRDGYKAGALQNGLRLARGTLIAIFDADFLPPRDFLLRMVPEFDNPRVGMVQARWGHLNGDTSLLTRLQAFGLDAHFAVEQQARYQSGLFMSFNGTAGIWRRACIEDAGGWQADTLTEDLDLSYRAQLRGWRFKFVSDLEVPAELPADLGALRTQQFRWTKGAAETALKLLGTLWRSGQALPVKLEGTLHLTAHTAFPFVLLAALLHAPLLLLRELGYGPGEPYFAAMGLGLFGLAGFFLAHAFAQHALYPDWRRRLLLFPLFMAGSMGMALSNTRAVWQAFRRKRSPFVRTPKYPARQGSRSREGARTRSWSGVPADAWLELGVASYGAFGLVLLIWQGVWAGVPFQALYVLGFALLALPSLRAVPDSDIRSTIPHIELADLSHNA